MWELKRTYRKAYRIIRVVIAVLLFAGGIMALLCGIGELIDYRNIEMLIVAIVVIISAIAMLIAAYFSIDGLRFRIIMNEDGVALHKGKKEVRLLQWDQISDVGIGYQTTHIGKLKTMYLADCKLSDEMRNHLELVGGNCIYMIDMTEEELELFKRKCRKGSEDVSRWIQER